MLNGLSPVRANPQDVGQADALAEVFADITAVRESAYQAAGLAHQRLRASHGYEFDDVFGPESGVSTSLGALKQTLHSLDLEQLPEEVIYDLNYQVHKLSTLLSRLPSHTTTELISITDRLTDLAERAYFQGQDPSVVKVFADIKTVQRSINQAVALSYDSRQAGDDWKRNEILGPTSPASTMLAELTRTLHSLNLEPLSQKILLDLKDEVSALSYSARYLSPETTSDLSSIEDKLTCQEERATLQRVAQLKEHSDHGDYLRQLLADPTVENADSVFDRALGVPTSVSAWHEEHTREMLGYQPTPLRPLAELLTAMEIGPNDIFCDLGAGLGRPSLLVHLLTGARCISVEYVKDTHELAKEIADNNNIHGIEYVNADAATFDMRRANKFFLFNPFKGDLLDTVVRKLEERVQAGDAGITVGALGPCIRAFEKSPHFTKVGDDFKTWSRGAVFKGKVP